jgi:NDP-sugar pyrophosphorylase family protein
MKSLFYKNFFDIKDFSYKNLFENKKTILDSLIFLPKYLSSYNFKKIQIKIPPSCHLLNKEFISIGKNTTIEDNVYIKGPCIIGDNCTIRYGAYIRGNVVIGSNSLIGHSTEIKNSIILNNINAAHFAYIGDSLIGNNVNLGAGVKCANFRLDKEKIFICIEDKKIPTNLKKFGAIISDNSQIGCNSILNPGTIIGKNVHCFGLLNLFGYIPKNSIVKPSSQFSISNRENL